MERVVLVRPLGFFNIWAERGVSDSECECDCVFVCGWVFVSKSSV